MIQINDIIVYDIIIQACNQNMHFHNFEINYNFFF